MFPEMNEDLQNQILNINANTETIKKELGRSFKFDFDTGQFILSDGKLINTPREETIRQWISLCVRTCVDKYEVYKSTGFGVNLEKIIGHKLNIFYRQVIVTEIQKGLLKNTEIKSVDNIELIEEKDKLFIKANIKLTDNSTLDVEEMV
ncbi:hypothetical protein AGR56_09150 [Clostridium sp. DMHC 10]|uniref:DUF2634 domain-containing protein n=1 Tax=Clostridium sp. DMHC 10 TaxID=747377 RepID=UPI00069EBF57|nr:DUF2634 domain-containing protein [Clostridium sp. DMHC 10]KOF56818.1 hypothetical protein AGR56_09150 [Clostridium sp. DMHC 10]